MQPGKARQRGRDKAPSPSQVGAPSVLVKGVALGWGWLKSGPCPRPATAGPLPEDTQHNARGHLPWAFKMAAFPRPAPEPWFLFFMLFSMGAFFSMSGKIRKRILLPRMYTCSSCATRPSLYVTVMLDIWKKVSSSVGAHSTSGEQGPDKEGGPGRWEECGNALTP